MHFGEGTSGLILGNDALPNGGLPPGYKADPANPYWRFMGAAAVAEAKARGCTLLLANGDLTSEARPKEVAESRALLDTFGTLAGATHVGPRDRAVYYVTRGNHDRLHSGALYNGCSKEGAANDCFGDAFAGSYEGSSTHFSVSIGTDKARYRFVGLDSNDPAGMGILPRGELDYLEEQLARGEVTIPLFHHPASDVASLSQMPPGVFGVRPDDALAFRQLLARHDNVGGVYSGHTHRNNRSVASGTGELPFFEGGATKEYPGGYTVVRLYETGYLVNFYKAAAPEARAWSERSRGEYLGLYPYYTLGSLADRNWSYDVDARVRTSAPTAAPQPSEAPRTPPGSRPPSGRLPSTGVDAAVALAGVTAAVGAAAVHRAARADRPDA
jgi:3',5'-cyclic AMP phosphodiesterase CpdA